MILKGLLWTVCKPREGDAFDYTDSLVLSNNRFGESVQKTFVNSWKNKENYNNGQMRLAFLNKLTKEKYEIQEIINQLLASQNMVKTKSTQRKNWKLLQKQSKSLKCALEENFLSKCHELKLWKKSNHRPYYNLIQLLQKFKSQTWNAGYWKKGIKGWEISGKTLLKLRTLNLSPCTLSLWDN